MRARDRPDEVFKAVPGFPGYVVSNLGKVKSLARKDTIGRPIKEKLLKPGKNSRGYMCVVLRRRGASHTKTVHTLVATAFLGPRPEGFQVNHIDEDKRNNRLDNLEYVTPKENTNHGTRNKRAGQSLANHRRLSRAVLQMQTNGARVTEYPSVREAARVTGIKQSGITRCCLGERKSAGGYRWIFK